MQITIDTEAGLLRLNRDGGAVEHSLFSREAFRILSQQWIVLGWNLGHWTTFSWMGRQLLQLPDDVLRLAELFWRLRPDVIVETGVYDGGSTLLFASLCRLNGRGRVISIECEFRPGVREAIDHTSGDLVLLIEGDSALPETAKQVERSIRQGERVCVFLDSSHGAGQVAAELGHLGLLVSEGCYLIVADSICSSLAHTPAGERKWLYDHPAKAVDEFLAGHPEFARERPEPLFAADYDFTGLSYFPATWLKRRET
jgi:cephalosporin hydroxylase